MGGLIHYPFKRVIADGFWNSVLYVISNTFLEVQYLVPVFNSPALFYYDF
jgi:hypothetical protein